MLLVVARPDGLVIVIPAGVDIVVVVAAVVVVIVAAAGVVGVAIAVVVVVGIIIVSVVAVGLITHGEVVGSSSVGTMICGLRPDAPASVVADGMVASLYKAPVVVAKPGIGAISVLLKNSLRY
jgi:hypothetical protein